jgi:uncharacterized protein (UPF0332 family)
MSEEEQQAILAEYYAEAMRCMDEAGEALKKANKGDSFYYNPKLLRTACRAAYNGVLLALDAYLMTKGVKPSKRRKPIEYYQDEVRARDRKLLDLINRAYDVLYLAGHYDGVRDAEVLQTGFNTAYDIIERIKPVHVH